VGQEIVLRIDLRDFFPSVTRGRIIAILLTAGYPEPIALRLAGICTSRVPRAVLEDRPPGLKSSPSESFRLRKLFEAPHLPQGAPSSPALANLTAHRLDCRLTGLATAAGAHYTRYADDLVFSGGPEFARRAERFAHHVCVVALEEGFEVHSRKTRIMRKSVSQRAAGLVINEGICLPRKDVDALKAILHNCVRLGPASQNHGAHPDFRAHLLGRISYLATNHSTRAAKLRRHFDQIDWSR
jgi:RNA-directed DNA polymerase